MIDPSVNINVANVVSLGILDKRGVHGEVKTLGAAAFSLSLGCRPLGNLLYIGFRINSISKLTLKTQLESWLKDAVRVAVLGIGSTIRTDDGAGPSILKKLEEEKLPSNIGLFNCGVSPESFTGSIKRFQASHILIIDTAHLEVKPGETRLVPLDKVKGLAVSTHTLPLSMLAKYLESTTNAKTILLAIQPQNIEFGDKLTPELEEATDRVADMMVEVFKKIFEKKS